MIARILLAGSLVALAICGVAGAQTRGSSHVPGRPLGIVHPQIDGVPVGSWAARNAPTGDATPTVADDLTYSGPDQSGHGPVMRTNTVYTIFWVPSGYSVPSNYQALVNRYFADVAADSGKTSNVYSTDVQYHDTTGAIQYKSTYAGTAVDTHAFYASDCTTPGDVPNVPLCMSDGILQKEVKRFADAKGWPHGANTEFFLYTAHNVETCFLSDAQAASDPVDQACSYDYYCAYHNSFTATNGEYIYSNMPYPNQTFNDGSGQTSSVCVSSGEQGLPNSGGAGAGTDGAAADEAINVTSHEHNESITDPTGDAWWVDNPGSVYNGYENGDLCGWYFPSGAVIGGTGTTRYNQLINGHHYFVQGEWSNDNATATPNSGCVWSYNLRPSDTAAPYISGTPVVGQTLTASAGTWTGSPTGYQYKWERCNTSGTGCIVLSTSALTTSVISQYTIVSADAGHTLRLQVLARNAHGYGTPALSAPTPTIVAGKPAATAAPTVTGTTTTGQALTAHAGTWSNAPTQFQYQWQQCSSTGTSCTIISTTSKTASTTANFTVRTADVGHTLRVKVFAYNVAGSGTAYSQHTAAITSGAAVAGKPAVTTAPTISGTAAVGQTLTGHAGSWTNTPTSYAYQWQQCSSTGMSCTIISTSSKTTATSASFTVRSADHGHTLKLKVFAYNAAGSAGAYSTHTAVVS